MIASIPQVRPKRMLLVEMDCMREDTPNWAAVSSLLAEEIAVESVKALVMVACAWSDAP